MRRLTIVAVAVLALGACSDIEQPLSPPAVELAPFHPALGARAVLGDYIVVLNRDANPRAVAASAGARATFVYSSSINGFAATLSEQAVNALRRNPNVAYIEMDQIVTLAPPCGTPKGGPCDDPPPPGGGGDDPPSSQTVPWGITRVGGGVSGASGTAWVIDSGIDLDHPDLNVDVGRSVNFVTRGKSSPDDGNGHGTHVAGTIAAIDNDIDVIGVAAGAKVVAVRVLDNSGSGSYSWVIAGVDYVAANGASGDVANMSLGGPVSQALDNAVLAAAGRGIRFTLAAGNSGVDANTSSPARVNGNGIYTISAIAQNNCLTSWSNWGTAVDFAEPGSGILSTKRGGGTTTMSGTSMAAPHAAGLLLLGNIRNGGTACNDPDGNADVIGIR